ARCRVSRLVCDAGELGARVREGSRVRVCACTLGKRPSVRPPFLRLAVNGRQAREGRRASRGFPGSPSRSLTQQSRNKTHWKTAQSLRRMECIETVKAERVWFSGNRADPAVEWHSRGYGFDPRRLHL